MSSKRYAHKLIESTDVAEFEGRLTDLGGEGWEAVGYAVLPSGARSALLQRKERSDRDKHHDTHHHEHDHQRHDHEHAEPARGPADRSGN